MAIEREGLRLELEATVQRFEAEMRRAVKSGTITATEIERRFTKMETSITRSSTKAAAGLQRVMNVSGRGRFVLTNTANQLGDIAVQLASGTAASRVMAQQLPQLLGGFGALNGALGILAPLLGTVAAVGIPVVAFLWKSARGAEAAAEETKSFAEQVGAAQSAIDKARAAISAYAGDSLEGLEERYGEVTAAVRTLVQELSAIEMRAAQVEVSKVIDAALGGDFEAQINKVFGAVGSALVEGAGEGLAEAQKLLAEMEADIATRQAAGMFVDPGEIAQLTELREEVALLSGDFAEAGDLAAQIALDPDLLQQIHAVEAGLRAANEAGDFAGVADGLARVRELLAETGMEIDQNVIDALVKAEDKARQLAATFDQSAEAAENLAVASGSIGAALQSGVAAANALYAGLQSALGVAQAIANANIDWNKDFGGGKKTEGGPVKGGGKPVKEKSTGGGGGGSGSTAAQVDQLAAAFDRLRAKLDPAWKAAQDFAAAQEALNWALAEGKINQAEFNALLAEAQQEYSGYADLIADLNQDLKDGLIDSILQAETFGDVLDGIIDKLAKAALQAALFGEGPLAGLFGGPGLFGGLDFFAGGTSFAPGGPAIVGEKGPELVYLPRGSEVVPNHRISQAGAQARIDVHVHPSGEFDARVAQVSGGVAVNVARQVVGENNRRMYEAHRR